MASRRIEDLDPRFQPLVQLLLERVSLSLGSYIPFITDGLRTNEEQTELYSHGRNGDPRPIVTNAQAGQSPHNWGLAVDIAFKKLGDPKTYYNPELYATVYSVARNLGFVLGADWKDFPDSPHFEYPNWKIAKSDLGYNDPTVYIQGGAMSETDARITQLITKYKVQDIDDLDRHIEENTGTTWGAEDKPGGGFLGEGRRQLTETKKQFDIQVQLASDRQTHLTDISRLLNLPVTADISQQKAEITGLMGKEDDLRAMQEKMAGIEEKHRMEIESLKAQYQAQIDRLRGDLDTLQDKLNKLSTQEETVSFLSGFFKRIFTR